MQDFGGAAGTSYANWLGRADPLTDELPIAARWTVLDLPNLSQMHGCTPCTAAPDPLLRMARVFTAVMSAA